MQSWFPLPSPFLTIDPLTDPPMPADGHRPSHPSGPCVLRNFTTNPD
ncbi:hypothetical protein H8E07_09630 [bacterium]|nr:hypothetical protein [bacterium]